MISPGETRGPTLLRARDNRFRSRGGGLPTGALQVCAVLTVAGMSVAGCSSLKGRDDVPPVPLTEMAEADIDLGQAETANRNRMVLEQFRNGVQVTTDPFGVDTVELLFPDSEALIIADKSDSAQLRAASLAVAQHAPMVVYDDSNRGQLTRLIDALGVERVLLVGEVPFATSSGSESVRVIKDSGTTKAMGKLTAFQFTSQVVAQPASMVQAVADLDANAKVELKAAWQPLMRREGEKVAALPAQSRRDSDMAPVFIATPSSPVAAVATARAWGGEIRVMPTGNPQDSKAAFAMVVGLSEGWLVGLGGVFGDRYLLSDRIKGGWQEAQLSPSSDSTS